MKEKSSKNKYIGERGRKEGNLWIEEEANVFFLFFFFSLTLGNFTSEKNTSSLRHS